MDGTAPPANAEQVFLDNLPLIDEAIRFVCRRYRCSADESQEFAAHSRLKFVEGGYAVLRKFAGRSSLRTYLTIVVRRQFLDLRRQQWGTWRPSAEARRLGAVAVRLDTMLHRDRVGLEEAIDQLRDGVGAAQTPDELRRLAGRLPAHYARRMEGEAALTALAIPAASVEQVALADGDLARRQSLAAALAAAMEELPEADRLALRLRFEDGIPVARIAQVLRLDPKPLYRHMMQVLQALRRRLEEQGFTAAEVADGVGKEA